MTKKDRVYRYLKEQLNSGKTENQLFKLTAKDLQQVPELNDISGSTISESFALFKKEHKGALSTKTVGTGTSEDLRGLLHRLKEKEDLLFQLLEEQERKQQIQGLDLSKDKKDAIKKRIMEEYPIPTGLYKEGMGIGVRIESSLFQEFQHILEECGLSQRYGIHVAIKLFNEYGSKYLDEYKEGSTGE